MHEYFDDLADAMIVSNRPGGKVSRQLLGEVLSRVAVKTPPEATREQIAAGDMLRVPLPLSEGSVSKATAALRYLGLFEDGPVEKGAGRPLTKIRLGSERWFCIGVHVRQSDGEISELRVVAVSLDDSRVLADDRATELAPRRPLADLTNAVVEAIERITVTVGSRAVRGRLPLLGVGVEINCPVRDGSAIDRSGKKSIPYDIRDKLTAALGVPVVVENDANVLAIRQTYGTKIENQDFALILVTDGGVGAAVSVGGRVYRGSQGFAGELGHVKVDRAALPVRGAGIECWCGGVDHLDAYATPFRIRERLSEKAASERKVYTAAGRALGHGLVALVSLCNPAEILLLVPEWLGEPALRDAYLKAAEAEISAAGIRHTSEVLDRDQLAVKGARAAATRVLIEFIDHLSGIDGCLPEDRSAAALTPTRGAAAIAGAALTTPLGAAVGAVVGGAIGATFDRRNTGAAVGRAGAQSIRARSRQDAPGPDGWTPPWELSRS